MNFNISNNNSNYVRLVNKCIDHHKENKMSNQISKKIDKKTKNVIEENKEKNKNIKFKKTKVKNMSASNVKSKNIKYINNEINYRKLVLNNKNVLNGKNEDIYYNTITYTKTAANQKQNLLTEFNKESCCGNYDNTNKKSNHIFDLFENLKQNKKNYKNACQEPISKNSIYCFDCMTSSCPNCLTYSLHNNHNYIYTYDFYFDVNKIFEECFNDIDCLFSLNPFYLDINKIKGEIKMNINNQINKIIEKLTDIKKNKIKEIDNLICINEDNIELLKNKKNTIKSNIISFINKQNAFLNFKSNNNSDNNFNNNNDIYNISFLLRYELLKNTEVINSEIKSIILDIKANTQKYIDIFNKKINNLNDYINDLNEEFQVEFKYKKLNSELYKEIDEKLLMINHKIELIKRNIFDKINRKRGIETIKKENKILSGSFNKKYLNLFELDISERNQINKFKTFYNRKKIKKENTPENIKPKININNDENNIFQSSNNIHPFQSLEDICLNGVLLQKFYYLSILNMISINNNNNHTSVIIPKIKENKTEQFKDKNYKKITQIPETNEIHIFNQNTGKIIKKKVKFNICNQKYSYFLNGSRSILINNILYIFGGVSKEKKESKISYAYSIDTNELSIIPEMIKSHSYHSLYYIEKYSSILVIGGENNNSCELYNINSNSWTNLPDMVYHKANCSIYYDNKNDSIYTFFGIAGKITESNNYLDVIECLDFKEIPLVWKKIKYNNKAELDSKGELLKIIPISDEIILIKGGHNKKAIYFINKKEIVKFDWKIFNQISYKFFISDIHKINL